MFPDVAGEDGTTYVSLFDVIVTDAWTPVWQEYIGAVIGEETGKIAVVGNGVTVPAGAKVPAGEQVDEEYVYQA